jgi:hypothetical protein
MLARKQMVNQRKDKQMVKQRKDKEKPSKLKKDYLFETTLWS